MRHHDKIISISCLILIWRSSGHLSFLPQLFTSAILQRKQIPHSCICHFIILSAHVHSWGLEHTFTDKSIALPFSSASLSPQCSSTTPVSLLMLLQYTVNLNKNPRFAWVLFDLPTQREALHHYLTDDKSLRFEGADFNPSCFTQCGKEKPLWDFQRGYSPPCSQTLRYCPWKSLIGSVTRDNPDGHHHNTS